MNLVLWTSILSIWINPMSAVTVTLTSGIDDNGYTAKTHKIAGSRADVEITADTLDYGNKGSNQKYQHDKGSPNQYFPGNRIIHRSNAKTRWKEDEWEYFEPNISHVSFSRRKRNLGSNILIVQRFGPKIIAPGEDISLQCIATADRPPRFTWERDGVVITSNTDSRYTLGQTISGAGVTAQLNISRARVDDGGRYACSAGDARAVHAARIDVYGPPYIRTLPPIKVQSGEPLKLRCPYYGYPISKLEWENKGKKILTTTLPHISRYKRSYGNNIKSERRKGTNMLNSRGREKRQVFDSDEEGVLNIPSLEKEDNGVTYTCVVYSPSGEMARRAFEIQVVEAPVLDELRVGTGLKEGQIVQITCNIISGDPPIYFSWLKDGKKIPPNMKITERSSELFSVLIIKKVSLEHCGRYTCIATNHVGKVDQSSDLFINVAPKWVVEPSNSSLLLGRRGVVHCRADGHPAPQIHWMKKDATLGIWRPVLDLAGGGVMSYSNGTLVIEVVSLSDEGMYSCNVENGMGEPLNKNLWINVNKPVHFESAAMNLTTKKGLPINLTCKPLGDSPIRIKWSMDGRLIDFTTSRIAVSESPVVNGLKSIISISYTESKDAGHYECRASNPFGVASYNIYLDVLEPPPPPAEVAAWAAGGARAHLRWSSPRAPPAPRAHYYTVQYAPAGGAATALNVTRQDDILQTFELTNLQPATDYTVRVAAGNQVDLSPFSEPVHFTTQMEAPSSPPLGVQVQSTENPGELFISWMSPSKETHNGVLQGYHVKAVPKISGEQDSTDSHTKILKVISRNDKQETTMSGLLKNTRYAVSISAFNSAGNGPFSLPVYQTTREGAPESAPSGVECAGGAAAARAGWRPPAGGAPRGYHVYYAPDDGPWQNVTTPHTEIYLQGLLKYTNYSLKVAAFSSYGVGPFSYPVVCTTLQDVPDPPAAIKVLMSSPTSIIVSWKPPEHPNGEITHYTIDVKLISSSSPAISVRAEAAATWAAVRGLAAAAQYAVTVRAHTAAGAGGERAHHVHTVPRGHAGDARVVAGVASLGGVVAVGAGRSALLPCVCVGVPPPRTVWYHQHNIITHHPRFTRNHDDSLLINNIDQSLSGNYTCLAKNLYGSDSVSYSVVVLPAPAPPAVRVTSHKNSLHLQWDEPRRGPGKGQKIVYSLSWKQASGSWQDAFTNQAMSMHGVQEYTLEDLKCGTKYSIKMTATNSVGTSQPAYIEASTLGGVPIAPTTNEWFWSNSSHISIQLSGWDDNGCEIHTWKVEYKTRGGVWKLAKTSRPSPSSLSLGSLSAAAWYSIRVTATSDAGPAAATYRVATTTVTGEIIGPPSEFLDINMLVIICSSILLLICSVTCVYILVKRHQQQRLTSYRNSLTAECKSERSNVTVHTPQSTQPDVNTRVYSTPVHLHGDGKHELYEISPYAQFALGFRTLGHVENNEAPHSNTRYQTETSFQMRSESEESDCVSRTTTLKSAPRKACRIPHHR